MEQLAFVSSLPVGVAGRRAFLGQAVRAPAEPHARPQRSDRASRTAARAEKEDAGNQPVDAPGSPASGSSRRPVSRREILRWTSVAAGTASMAWVIDRTKMLRYVSPRALMNAVLPANAATYSDNDLREIMEFLEEIERAPTGLYVGDFPEGLEWLNVSRPLSTKRELKGKLVLFDFWTYCCINCMHVLPDLAYLEEKYRHEALAVVGVHSAKFDNEQDSANIREAVLRYEIEHPVVNDPAMRLWSRLGVDSWPTFALVSPRSGRVIARLSGEKQRDNLDAFIAAALQFYAADLNAAPLPIALERDKGDARPAPSTLRYPGKLAVDSAGGRLFVSDSNNNRIVITDAAGRFIDQVGSGEAGLQDGDFASARFYRPQGLAYDAARDCLYVADTEAHALREVDLAAGRVRTLAGTGTQGRDYKGGRKGAAQELSSPWDVAVRGGAVYVAMAGTHQIWAHELASGETRRVAGSGRELNANVSGRDLAEAAFAQPSGLAFDPATGVLYIADSESSSVRVVDEAGRATRTLVGGDPLLAANLFAFGDVDGSGSGARLQHPLGVCCPETGLLYVADSYNHKIKRVDVASASIRTLAGTGKAGFRDGAAGEAMFSEPAGLALAPGGGALLVADTNNGAIRSIDLATLQVTTLDLGSVPETRAAAAARSAAAAATRAGALPAAEEATPLATRRAVSLEAAALASGGRLALTAALPEGYAPTKGATSRYQVLRLEGDVRLARGAQEGALAVGRPLELAFEGRGRARVEALVYYCAQGREEVCLVDAAALELEIAPGGAPRADVPFLARTLEQKRAARGPN
eukprot:tig00001339_g8266.t1